MTSRHLRLIKTTESVNETFLRMVIIDHPRLLLDNPTAFAALGDMIKCRQGNFIETCEEFLVLDKHDLIGTHILVYDTQSLFTPRLVAGFRITYEGRAKEFGLPMPIESLLSACPPAARKIYKEFRAEKGPGVQFNTLYIDPEYTYSRSSLRLSDMLFFAVCAYIRRLGINHYVGATNDRLKTDRWMKRAGNYSRPTYSFNHPDVQDPHTLFFIDSINDEWLLKCFETYAHYWRNIYEIIPDQLRGPKYEDIYQQLLQGSMNKKAA